MRTSLTKDIKYIKQNTCFGQRIYWIDEDWNNENFFAFLNSINDCKEYGRILVNERNLLIHLNADPAKGIKKDIVVKNFKIFLRWDKFRFSFIPSKAVRSLEISLILNAIGIKIPKPIALVEERGRLNILLYNFFVSEYLNYDYSLREICHPGNPFHNQINNILPLVARDIQRIHNAGIIHNDLNKDNILIKNINGNPELYFIDLNRAKIKPHLNLGSRMRDLARLYLPKEELEILLKNYDPVNYEKLSAHINMESNFQTNLRKLKKKVRTFFGIERRID